MLGEMTPPQAYAGSVYSDAGRGAVGRPEILANCMVVSAVERKK